MKLVEDKKTAIRWFTDDLLPKNKNIT